MHLRLEDKSLHLAVALGSVLTWILDKDIPLILPLNASVLSVILIKCGLITFAHRLNPHRCLFWGQEEHRHAKTWEIQHAFFLFWAFQRWVSCTIKIVVVEGNLMNTTACVAFYYYFPRGRIEFLHFSFEKKEKKKRRNFWWRAEACRSTA